MKSILTPLSALTFIICLMAMPHASVSACAEALEVCTNILFPSLFPFFVMSDIFVKSGGADIAGRYLKCIMKPLFSINGNGAAAFVLGMISGYPVGAKVAVELKNCGKISPDEGKRLVCFTNNCGPMFIIGALGSGMLASKEAGLLLYAIHFLSSVTLGMLLRRFGKGESPLQVNKESIRQRWSFTEAVEGAMASVIRVSAFVVFFAVIMRVAENVGIFTATVNILKTLGIKESISDPLIRSAIEMTTGLKKLSASDNALSHKLILSSFILGWSGLSVIFQSKSVSENIGIKIWQYALARFCHGCIGALYTYILLKLPIMSFAVSGKSELPKVAATIPKAGVTLTLCIGILYLILRHRSKDKHRY